jgi:cytochrome c-type protein NapC
MAKPANPIKGLIGAFKNPQSRPRMIIWTGTIVLVFAAVMITTLGITSTKWFCANGCHKVQDDTIAAYEHGSHSNISCIACHMPVNGSAVTFMLHKVEAMKELYETVTDGYELPLNGESKLAMEEVKFPDEQCTQCHSENRVVTPAAGVIIDHKVHAKNKVRCVVCHNRVAHPEDQVKFTLKDPQTKKLNHAHENWIKMEACFRCHGAEEREKAAAEGNTTTAAFAPGTEGAKAEGEKKPAEGAKSEGEAKAASAGAEGEGGEEGIPVKPAPGKCSVCHPKGFELKPKSHQVKGFFTPGDPAASKGHGKLKEDEPGLCVTCHDERKFCTGCHGVQMPHPSDFKDQHGKQFKKGGKIADNGKIAVCVKCHGTGATGTAATATSLEFCNACHHKGGDPKRPWRPQHPEVVRTKGATACFDCHDPVYCAHCHVSRIK